MNSEELEISLRTEFESYLKNSLAEMRQEISQLQEKVTTELERHKSQLDEVFTVAIDNIDKERVLEPSFKEAVIEHLRLAKDEGAKITAMAIAQAEELEKENAAQAKEVEPSVGVKEIHEAVNEISQKSSQSEILKTLVHHATFFAPRGAFFIIKNEHLVGWRVFGKEKGEAEEKVREVFLPVSANSILSNAVKSLETVQNSDGFYSDDAEIFGKLEFDEPKNMYAIPLVARGRGVAVLYADQGSNGTLVNVDALETLIRVAGLTVEVLASAKAPSVSKKSGKKPESYFEEETTHSQVETREEVAETVAPITSSTAFVSEPVVESVVEPVVEPVIEPVVETSYQTTYTEETFVTPSYETQTPIESFVTPSYEPEMPVENSFSTDYVVEEKVEETSFTDYISDDAQIETKYPEFEATSWSSETDTTPSFSAQEFAENFAKETDPTEYAKDFSYDTTPVVETTSGFEFESSGGQEPVYSDTVETPIVEKTEEFVPTEGQTYGSFEPQTEPVSQPISTPPSKTRLSERNVDLPIEVSEDERRLHNDARRFARLLVSEIKLYNEQKVKEGRDGSDLYDRLREAIDRSREMYDKRVQPPVAAKFDYFHYELVNTLAEGDDNKLGASYPGSTV